MTAASQARAIVDTFKSSPFATTPSQAKYYAGLLIDSHIMETNDGKFSLPEDFQRNNEKWRAIRKELDKI